MWQPQRRNSSALILSATYQKSSRTGGWILTVEAGDGGYSPADSAGCTSFLCLLLSAHEIKDDKDELQQQSEAVSHLMTSSLLPLPLPPLQGQSPGAASNRPPLSQFNYLIPLTCTHTNTHRCECSM